MAFSAQQSDSAQLIVFLLCMLIPVGYTYNYDLFQPLQTQMEAAPFNFDITDYNLLYFFTNLAGIIFTLLGGVFLQYFGSSSLLRIVALGTLLSVLLTTLSVYLVYLDFHFWKLFFYLSRLIFGVFGQTNFSLSIVMLTKYSSKKNQVLFVGLGCSLPWTFQSLNSIVTPWLFEMTGKAIAPLAVGLLITVAASAAAFILTNFDLAQGQHIEQSESTINEEESLKFDCLFQLEPITYYIVFMGFVGESLFAPFVQNANQLLTQRFCMEPTRAGSLLAITMVMVCISTFAWSAIDRRLSKRTSILLLSTSFSASYLLFLLLPTGSATSTLGLALSIALHGFSYAGYLVILYVCISVVESKVLVGTAYGMMGASQNLAMAVVPILTATIVASSSNRMIGYQLFLYFFLAVSFVLCGLAYVLYAKRGRAEVLDRLEQENSKDILIQLDSFS